MRQLTLLLRTRTWLVIAICTVLTGVVAAVGQWQLAALLGCILGCLIMWKSEAGHAPAQPVEEV